MTNSFHTELQRTLDILQCESHSLLCLARMSGYDPFEFYRSANLSGLDLSYQDLRGLNFDAADMRGCRLKGILYDAGAFNSSVLDGSQDRLRDGYDIYFGDIMNDSLNRLYIFIEFRSESVEEIIRGAGFTYSEVARDAGISPPTLRKARQAQPLALETARSFSEYVARLVNEEPGYLRSDWATIRQPVAKIIVSEQDGSFSQLCRRDIPGILAMSDEILELRKVVFPSTYSVEQWRDKPTAMKSTIRYLRAAAGVRSGGKEPAAIRHTAGQMEFNLPLQKKQSIRQDELNSGDTEFRAHDT